MAVCPTTVSYTHLLGHGKILLGADRRKQKQGILKFAMEAYQSMQVGNHTLCFIIYNLSLIHISSQHLPE